MNDEAAVMRLPSVGTKVGDRYRLERKMAAGGMGVVYEAIDLAHPERARVALKILRPEVLDVHDVVERFQREAGLAQRIDHPNVVRVLDSGASVEGLPFMVMELLRGRDVSDELKRTGPMSVEAAARIVVQAARGVAAAHALRIVHRDLKPSNLFLVAEPPTTEPDLASPRVKVLDFGVSKALDTDVHVTATNLAVGTPLYMSPEQVRSAKTVDARTDVWALGVILFQLLTRRTPFEGDTSPAVAASIVADEPLSLLSLRPDAPDALASVIGALLEKNVAKRVPTAEAVIELVSPFESWGRAEDPTVVFANAPRRWRQTVKMAQVDVGQAAQGSTGENFPAAAPAPFTPPSLPSSSPSTTPGWTPGHAALVPAPPRPPIALAVVAATIFACVTALGVFLVVRSPKTPTAPLASATSPEPSSERTMVAPARVAPDPPPTGAMEPPIEASSSSSSSASASSATVEPPPLVPTTLAPTPRPTPPLPPPKKDCARERKILVGGKLVCP